MVRVLVVLLAVMLAACTDASKRGEVDRRRSGPEDRAARHFESPEAAVKQIADMLREQNFATLAMYYDLSGTGIDRATLRSGAFFVRSERSDGAHPAGLWKHKQPFAPGFGYAGHHKTRTPNVFIVDVSIRIDQGAGSPPQIGYDEFRMRQTAAGWAVLPDQSK